MTKHDLVACLFLITNLVLGYAFNIDIVTTLILTGLNSLFMILYAATFYLYKLNEKEN
jgi:hypothetical protein